MRPLLLTVIVTVQTLRIEFVKPQEDASTKIKTGSETFENQLFLTNTDDTRYIIERFDVYYNNHTFVNMFKKGQIVSYQFNFELISKIIVDLQVSEVWAGFLVIQISGFDFENDEKINKQMTIVENIGPVLTSSDYSQKISSLQSATKMMYDNQKALGIILTIVRSIRLVSNLLLPFNWVFAMILMTGPFLIAPNLYYFTGIMSVLHIHYQVLDYSLNNCGLCSTPSPMERKLFYIFNAINPPTESNSNCLLAPYYEEILFYNLDFTLLFLIGTAFFVLLVSATKFQYQSYLQSIYFSFVEGSLFEVVFLSCSQIHFTAQIDNQMISVVQTVIAVLLLVFCFIIGLRPTIFYLKLQLTGYEPFRDEQVQEQVVETPFEKQKKIRRATGYPGKASISIQESNPIRPSLLPYELRGISFFSPFYKAVTYNLFTSEQPTQFSKVVLGQYQLQLVSQITLAIILPLLKRVVFHYLYVIGIVFLVIDIPLTIRILTFIKTFPEKIKNYMIVYYLLQLLVQVLLLSAFSSILSKKDQIIDSLVYDPNEATSLSTINSIFGSGQQITNILICYFVFSLLLWIMAGVIGFQQRSLQQQQQQQNFSPPPKQQKQLVEEKQSKPQHQHLEIEAKQQQQEIELIEKQNNFYETPPEEEHKSQQQPYQMKEAPKPDDLIIVKQLTLGKPEIVETIFQLKDSDKKIEQAIDKIERSKSTTLRKRFETQESQLDYTSGMDQERKFQRGVSQDMTQLENGVIKYDLLQEKVTFVSKKSLEYSKIFNEGTIKFSKSGLICIYSFSREVIIGGQQLKSDQVKFLKQIDQQNAKMFMNDMRIKGTHILRFQNTSKEDIHQSLPRRAFGKEGGNLKELLITNQVKISNTSLNPGDFSEVQQECSFDYISSDLNEDKIEAKGVYTVEDNKNDATLKMQKDEKILNFRVELCNSELRMIKAIPYKQKSFIKMQKAGKDDFVLIFEEKMMNINLKNVVCFIQHYQLLQLDMQSASNELQLSAFFGKLGIILAGTSYLTFHMIIETYVDKNALQDSENKSQLLVDKRNQYIMLSVFIKKKSTNMNLAHRKIIENFCKQINKFFQQVI